MPTSSIGSAAAPGLTQRLTFSAVASGVRRDLVQSHVYLSMLDVEDPHKRAVIRMVLTATATQHDSILGDFQDFLRTVRPDTGAASQRVTLTWEILYRDPDTHRLTHGPFRQTDRHQAPQQWYRTAFH
jgi:hypothetical protein